MSSERQKRFPNLRFPEFQGRDGWVDQAFRKLYEFKPTNSLSRDKLNYQNGDIRNIHYGDIHTKFSALFDISKEAVPFINAAEVTERFGKESFCEEGDMVFADASEDVADVGKSIEIVALHEEKLVSGTHTILARRKGKQPVLGFGGYLFRSSWIRTQIQRESQGAKVLGISPKRLSGILVAVPSTDGEQQKIADCLTSLDELITAQGRKVEALKSHKKGLMQQLFPREGESAPRLRFPEFLGTPYENTIPLGDVVDIASGQVNPLDPPYCDMPHIGGENIESNSGVLSGAVTAKELGLISGKYVFDGQAVLYSKIRPRLNKVATPSFEGICSADIYPIYPREAHLSRGYLAEILRSQSFLDYVKKHSDRGKIPKVNRQQLLAFTFKLPVLKEQKRVADCLAHLDELIAAAGEYLSALQKHKTGLMQQLFPSPDNLAT